MNSAWSVEKLGDYADILTGYPFESSQFTELSEDIRLLRGVNVSQGELNWADVKRWPITEKGEYSDYLLKLDDVIVAMDRPWVPAGLKYAWITEEDLPCLLVQRVARLRGKNDMLTDYIRYVVASQHFAQYLKNIVTGVNVPHISKRQIQEYKFPKPPLESQIKIVDFLRCFDDLIKLNTRRIGILDRIIWSIYDEWFVRFRFRGYEGMKKVPSELGEIPDGWKVRRLGDVVENIVLGGTPSRSKPDYWKEGTIPWINSGKLNDSRVLEGSEMITQSGLSSSATKLMPKRTVLIAITGAILVGFSEIELCANQSVVGIFGSKELSQEYIYLFEVKGIDHFISKMSGSAQQHVNKEIVENSHILVPDSGVMQDFNDVAKPLSDMISNLLFKNKSLRQARNLLLPKLISGEIDLATLEPDGS